MTQQNSEISQTTAVSLISIDYCACESNTGGSSVVGTDSFCISCMVVEHSQCGQSVWSLMESCLAIVLGGIIEKLYCFHFRGLCSTNFRRQNACGTSKAIYSSFQSSVFVYVMLYLTEFDDANTC